MRKINEENERIKRKYIAYLKQAKGQDEKSLEKALAAILKFEESTNFKPFKKFHIEQAGKFKAYLDKARSPRTGKPLSHSTTDATLRLVKGFFHWLAGQPGFKKRISYADSDYFNNNAKNARAAHAQRDIPYPSMQQAAHAFRAMPERNDIEQRDKAIFAFLMLTGTRVAAAASLRLKHIDLFNGLVNQDGREVNTKNSKSFMTYFLPVDATYRTCFEAWVTNLRETKLFGPEDALFPKPLMGPDQSANFAVLGLSRDNYTNGTKINSVIRDAFQVVQMQEYTAHSFRKTLTHYGNECCENLEQMKAWSMNLGHENLGTTISAYMPVSRQRQGELLKGLQSPLKPFALGEGIE